MNLEERMARLEAHQASLLAKQMANELVLRVLMSFTTTPALVLETALQRGADREAFAMQQDGSAHELLPAFQQEIEQWLDALQDPTSTG